VVSRAFFVLVPCTFSYWCHAPFRTGVMQTVHEPTYAPAPSHAQPEVVRVHTQVLLATQAWNKEMKTLRQISGLPLLPGQLPGPGQVQFTRPVTRPVSRTRPLTIYRPFIRPVTRPVTRTRPLKIYRPFIRPVTRPVTRTRPLTIYQAVYQASYQASYQDQTTYDLPGQLPGQ